MSLFDPDQDDSEEFTFVAIYESHSNVGSTVWDGLILVPIFCAAVHATNNLISARRRTDLIVLTFGLQLIPLWYFLHLLDGIIRVRHVHLPDSYVVALSIFWTIRVLSDVFILWGVIQFRRRFFFNKEDHPRLIDMLIAFPLFIVLFYIGMLFATDASLLDGKESAAYSLATGHLAVGAGYYALQFVASLGILSVAILDQDMLPGISRWNNLEDVFKDNHYAQYLLGLGFLAFRSFCEVIIAGEAHRNSSTLGKFEHNHEARCVLYGLVSVPFALSMAFAMAVSKEDTIQESKDLVEAEVRSALTNRLSRETENRTKTAPALKPILAELQQQVTTTNGSSSNSHEIRRRLKLRFVNRLMGRYADWEPILKQDSQVSPIG